MPKESVLTAAEKKSITIDSFIFHIIIADEEEPQYLDEVVLSDKQKGFFRERFVDASSGTQYLFVDKDSSSLAGHCNNVVNNLNGGFTPASRKIAFDFLSYHKGNTSDGVFIISQVTILKNVKLIFLVKMDHPRVLTYNLDESRKRAIIQEIANSFVEDKKAMQKVAIIDVSTHFAWDVLAYDRHHTNYFRSFLAVVEREDASLLTRKTVSTVFQWAKTNREDLPEEEEVSNYKSRAIAYMKNHDTFETSEFINMVVKDEVRERKMRMVSLLEDWLSEQGIAGQEFRPMPDSISSAENRNVRKTEEGVKIEWLGSASASGVDIPQSPNPNDDLYHITIKTRNIEIIK